MKNIKKTTVLTLLITILLTTAVFAITTFKDTKSSDWYMDTVSKLVERGGINGYPDGTFKPNAQITKAEFVKTIVASLGFNEELDTSPHWSSNYIRKAVALNIIDIRDFSSDTLDKTISRYDMAKVAVKTLEYNKEKFTEDYDKYANLIKDFSSIPNVYRDYVLKAYAKGIITGYPDGTFGGDRGLTRAEASTIIIRILETGDRILPVEPTEPITEEPVVEGLTTELSEEDIKRLQGYPVKANFYYEKFKESYNPDFILNRPKMIYEAQHLTPINFPPKEIEHISKENLKWFSSPRLIDVERETIVIRGILQKTENSKLYKADFEIVVEVLPTITYVDTGEMVEGGVFLVDNCYGRDCSGNLSDWEEIK